MANSPTRESVSKRMRFNVFKRDSFKCQYCGASAPDAVLNADHVIPVSKGGKTSLINLVTSCFACNSGKSNVSLSDNSAIKKQAKQLDLMQERRQQIEMLAKWRAELSKLSDIELSAACDAWGKACLMQYHFNELGRASVRKIISKHGLDAVLSAIESLRVSYLSPGIDGKITKEAVDSAYEKIAGACYLSSLPDYKKRLRYVRGILRNRFNLWGPLLPQILDDLESAYSKGVSIENMKYLAVSESSINRFLAELEVLVERANG